MSVHGQYFLLLRRSSFHFHLVVVAPFLRQTFQDPRTQLNFIQLPKRVKPTMSQRPASD